MSAFYPEERVEPKSDMTAEVGLVPETEVLEAEVHAAAVAEPKPSLRSRWKAKKIAHEEAAFDQTMHGLADQDGDEAGAEASGFASRLKAKFSSRRARDESRKTALAAAGDFEGLPITLLIGSLSGTARKDAEAFVRGLADSVLTSPEIGRVYVYDDRAHGRMVYEIHEGGPQRSIAAKVVAALDEGVEVRIALANGAHLSVERTHDQIFSLMHQVDEGRDELAAGIDNGVIELIQCYTSEVKLEEIYPNHNRIASLGGVLVGVSLIAFLIAGALFLSVRSGITQPDKLYELASQGELVDPADNPVWQLVKANTAAAGVHKSIRTLKKDAKGWTWELND